MTRLLAEKGADKHRVDAVGRGTLFYAAMSENVTLVQILLNWDPQNRNIMETYLDGLHFISQPIKELWNVLKCWWRRMHPYTEGAIRMS